MASPVSDPLGIDTARLMWHMCVHLSMCVSMCVVLSANFGFICAVACGPECVCMLLMLSNTLGEEGEKEDRCVLRSFISWAFETEGRYSRGVGTATLPSSAGSIPSHRVLTCFLGYAIHIPFCFYWLLKCLNHMFNHTEIQFKADLMY